MRVFHVLLNEEYDLQGGTLSCFLGDLPLDEKQADWKRPAVIVVPGGAYWFCSKREGEPVASYFLAKGFQTFVLTYKTCQEGVHYPEQLLELASAVDTVRRHAEEWNVNPDEVFVTGFSAGGHLTADLAVDFAYASQISTKALNCRPTAVGLSYPVITAEAGYTETHSNLLAGCTEEEKAKFMQRLNLDKLVTEKTPPAFIWTTAEDGLVPSENALRFALALAKNGIGYELHVYPQGGHGGSTWSMEINPGNECNANFFRRNVQWLENCAAFFRLYTKEIF